MGWSFGGTLVSWLGHQVARGRWEPTLSCCSYSVRALCIASALQFVVEREVSLHCNSQLTTVNLGNVSEQ